MTLWRRHTLFGPNRLSLRGGRGSAVFISHKNPGKNRAETATHSTPLQQHRCKIPQVKLLFSHLSIAIYKVASKSNFHHLRKITTQIKHLTSKKTSSFHYKGKLSLPGIPTPLSLTTQSPHATYSSFQSAHPGPPPNS